MSCHGTPGWACLYLLVHMEAPCNPGRGTCPEHWNGRPTTIAGRIPSFASGGEAQQKEDRAEVVHRGRGH